MSNRIAVVTGATGFVGKKLCLKLLRQGYNLRIFSRNSKRAKESLMLPAEYYDWDPEARKISLSALQSAEIVFHLAGEPIAEGRWSRRKKKRIWDSRVLATQNLVGAMGALPTDKRPRVLISSSAIGAYGNRGDEYLSETSQPSDTFLAKLCLEWEAAAMEAQTKLGIRTVCLRIGIVLGVESGALAKMLPLFRLGIGGRLGLGGKAWMSWIHVQDLVELFLFSAKNEKCLGILNAVAPEPVQNKVVSSLLAGVLGRPALFHAPKFLIQLILGEMSTVVLSSQRVLPVKALEAGFKFKFETLEACLKNLLKPLGFFGASTLEVVQWFPKRPESVFPFFSDAQNLEQITPPYLHFNIDRVSTPQIQQGTLIDYSLKIRGVPVKWKTLIESIESPGSFVDKQLKGPYALWHHTHTFESVAGGTLACDRVLFRVGWGIVGDLVSLVWVNRDVKTIFSYRKSVLKNLFGSP